jgi:hypothetical protein
MTPVGLATPAPSSRRDDRPVAGRRIAYATGMFVSVTLGLFSLLDGGTISVTVFSIAALVFLGLLVFDRSRT